MVTIKEWLFEAELKRMKDIDTELVWNQQEFRDMWEGKTEISKDTMMKVYTKVCIEISEVIASFAPGSSDSLSVKLTKVLTDLKVGVDKLTWEKQRNLFVITNR